MKIERAILLAFLGNFVINNIVGACVSLFKFEPNTYTQYAVYIVLASLIVAVFAWWYFKEASRNALQGAIFGSIAFVTDLFIMLFTTLSSVVTNSGSLAPVLPVLKDFVPFLGNNWTTLAFFGYWVVPATIVGFVMAKKSVAVENTPKPMI